MKSHKHIWKPALAAFAMLAVAACGASSGADEVNADGATVMEIGWQKSALISLPDLVAAEQDFFADRDIDAKLQAMDTGQIAVTAALRGELDMLYGPQSNIIQAASQGECFRVLTSGHGNNVNLVARKGTPMPSKTSDAFPGGLADMKGLRIGVPNLGSATDRNVREVLRAAGVQDSDVEFIAVGVGSTAVAALESDSIDALAVFPPASEAIPKGTTELVVDLINQPEESPLRDVIVSHQITTCDYLESNEEAVLNYCKAYLDARDFMSDPANAQAVEAVIAEYFEVSPEQAASMWKEYGAIFDVPTELTEQMWTAQAKFNSEQDQMELPYDEWVYTPCAAEDPRA